MPDHRDQDLLFAVTALQLRFVTDDVIAAESTQKSDAKPLRDRLIERRLLTPGEADAVDAVVRERLANSGNDPKSAVDALGENTPAEQTAKPPRDDPHGTVVIEDYKPPKPQRFRVLRVHQEGGLGRVSIASDTEFNREIALKEILPNRADDPDDRKRFVREAEITGALEHPGVVPVYSLGSHADGRPYYAMRFIRGVDLQRAIADYHDHASEEERPLLFRQLLGRFVSVCQTIDFAHNRGVLHRDLKPSNIMLGDYGETLVVDWGLAKASGENASSDDLSAPPVSLSGPDVADMTHAGKVVGTPLYMSPEQAEGRIDLLTPATDIYGLGATLYQIMTGTPPFKGEDVGVLQDVRRGRFPPPSQVADGVPKPLEAVCLKSMARQPSERYATAGDLALEIERYLADQPVQAHPEPLVSRAARWARRRRGLVFGMLTAATVALATLSVSVALLTEANRRERAARDASAANAVEAEKQRQRAEKNFTLARQAVNDYYVRISEEKLFEREGMQPLRDALLRQAMGYYQRFLAEQGDDESLLREVALAHFYTGRITETIDSPQAALPHYERALEIQQPLAAAEETPGEASADLGRTANARGRVLQKLRRLKEALSAFRGAIRLRQRLAESSRGDADRARELANSVMNAAVVRLQEGDVESALADFQRAQTLRRNYAVDLPDENPLIRDLAKGDYNVAVAQLTLGDAEKALASFRRSAEAFRRVTSAAPDDLSSRGQLANALRMMALVQSQQGDERAIANYRESAELLQRLAEGNPTVVDYQADLAGVRMNLAQTLADEGQLADSEVEIRLAVESLEALGPTAEQTPPRRRDLGVALRFLGELLTDRGEKEQARAAFERSRDVLQDLVKDHPGQPRDTAELSATESALEALDEQP